MWVDRFGHDRFAGVVREQHRPKDDALVHELGDPCRDFVAGLAQVQQSLGERLHGLIAPVDPLPRPWMLEECGGPAADAAVQRDCVGQFVALVGGHEPSCNHSLASPGTRRGNLFPKT